MKKHNISRRKSYQTRQIQFLKERPSFKTKVELSDNEKSLKLAALMLYWAEGEKEINILLILPIAIAK